MQSKSRFEKGTCFPHNKLSMRTGSLPKNMKKEEIWIMSSVCSLSKDLNMRNFTKEFIDILPVFGLVQGLNNAE